MNLLGWFLIALPLAIDVFAVGLVIGLGGLQRARWIRAALGFAAIGAAMMAAGIVAGDALEGAFGAATLYLAAAALLVIGARGILHGLKGDKADPPPRREMSPRQVAATGVVIAADKLAIGLSFAVLGAPPGPLALIVGVQAFAATLLGLALGARLGSKADDWAEIIAGVVFVVLGLAVLVKAVTGA